MISTVMQKYTGLEIAVIGLSCRFPGSADVAQYWENLCNGADCIRDFSARDAMLEGESNAAANDRAYVRSNAYLDNKDRFDAAFFNYRPEEAELMDPQMRMFHECCFEAMEDSGYVSRSQEQKIGLFAAGSPNLSWMAYSAIRNKDGRVDNFSAVQLRDVTYMSTRIAYLFDLKGPAVYVQTACSSSLVAIHQACSSLLLGECTMALAGGVTIVNLSKRGYLYNEGMIFSKDGRCRPYDIRASGTVAGEGAGVVVLKRLKDAIRDRDHIYAIIKGSAINNDGRSKAGYTAPGVQGQFDVIKKAQRMAKIEPASICYVEGHGTGTGIGDPVEVEALNEVFEGCNPGTCILGSVKSNFGHLDNASGVAGFIKAVLAIRNRKIPPTVHFSQPNPKINFSGGPFYVNNIVIDLKDRPAALRAGISSFGIGGTNAHVIIEEAPEREQPSPGRDHQLLLLSAKTAASLEGNTSRLIHYLGGTAAAELPDVAYTLQTGRERFKYRKMLVCEQKAGAVAALADSTLVATHTGATHEEVQRIIFLFPGQGAQYSNMCRGLYVHERIFRDKIDECLSLAKSYLSEDLFPILFPGINNDAASSYDITNTKYAQPLLFIVEYSLACLFMEWGIMPDHMIGHSIGEYVAACVSGVFSLPDAIRLVIRRGELMSRVEKGRMLSISMSEEQLMPFLRECEGIDLAVINSASSLVVSGREADIEMFSKKMTEQGYGSKLLYTSHAFHSRMMDDVLADFEREVAAIKIEQPKIPYVSNVTGTFVKYEEIRQSSYWSGQLRHTVQFLKGASLLLKEGNAVFIEMGPGNALCNYLSGNELKKDDHHLISAVRHSRQEIEDQRYLLGKIGLLWLKGITIKWDRFYQNEKRNKTPLPTYCFGGETYTTDLNMNFFAELSADARPVARSTAKRIHVPGWQRSIAPNFPDELSQQETGILVFADRHGFADRLINRLKSLHQQVVEVKSGWEPADLPLLWERLSRTGVVIRHIIYCPALDQCRQPVGYEQIAGRLSEGYLGLSYLAQSIVTGKQTQNLALTVVANYLAEVTQDDEVDPLKATILGPSKIIPSELINVICKVIDIPFPFAKEGEWDGYLAKLVNELFYPCDDVFIAYRHKERWVRAFYSLPEDARMDSSVRIREKGTYLITGGFGGMGFALAADLVYNHKANIVLTYRSAFPEREHWDEWLALHGEEDATSERIWALRDMEATGCSISLYRTDLSDEDSVRQFVADIGMGKQEINGLIWAAGEVDFGGIIQNRRPEDLSRYLSSKVHGVLLLEKYLRFEGLDFVALFSSVANVFYQTSFGQVAYNAANEFLECLPYHIRRKSGVHAFAIDWCAWLDVGMAVRAMMRNKAIADVAQANAAITEGIAPAEGIELFHRCLRSKNPVDVIYKGEITTAIAQQKEKYAEIRDAFDTRESPAEPVAEGATVETSVIALFRDFFGNSAISVRDDFFELGGDSLNAMTLVARINKHMGTSLSIKDIYSFSAIGSLIDEILKTSATGGSRIPDAPVKPFYVLSPAQSRMYFLQTMDDRTTVYNEVTLYWVKGRLDKLKLQNALSRLIERYEILRTVFGFEGSQPMQKILPAYTYNIEWLVESDLVRAILAFIRPFDLGIAPPFRVGVTEQEAGRQLLMIDMHHILTDALSTTILVKELLDLYHGEILPPVKLQYKDYAEWLQQEEHTGKKAAQQDFWLEKFSNFLVPELPTDHPRPEAKSYAGDRVEFVIDGQEAATLTTMAKESGASLYMTVLSLYCILLGKLSNQEDVILGTVTAGREHTDLENATGLFANTLPLRYFPAKTQPFREFLLQVKADTLAYFENQAFPYEELVEVLQLPRDTSRNPLFDIFFSFYNSARYEPKIGSLELEHCDDLLNKSSKFDLTLSGMETHGKLSLTFEYATALFREETIHRFIGYFRQIVAAVTTDPMIRIGEIDVLTAAERARLLAVFNGAVADYPVGDTLAELFEAQANRTPDHPAVVYAGNQLTYAGLNDQADRLAVYLQERYGIGGDTLVGMCMGRSEYLPVGILGVLKSGGAYVPMDPDYPADRIAYMVADTSMTVVLTDRQHAIRLSGIAGISLVVIDSTELQLDLLTQATLKPARTIKPDNLAYVIYTSGTTGRPKGVMVEHRNVVRLFTSTQGRYRFNDRDVWTLFHSYVFDFSVWELWGAFLYGGKLVVPGYEETRDLEQFFRLCSEQGVTVLNQTPSAFYQFAAIALHQPQSLDRLRYVIFGGEALNLSQLRSWFGRYKDTETRLINMYGITETTVHVTYKEIRATELDRGSLIGKVLPDLSCYILDENLVPLPMGATGELYVGGAGVSRGYLNRPELTEQRFIANPFQTAGEKAQGINGRLYKTGDMVRYLEDGSLVYIGRNDLQVKIRGYRIELGEIESRLSLYPGIGQCVVLVKDQLGVTKCLVAYYVAAQEFPIAELKNHLLQKLPAYMIPAFFIHLRTLPMTINGKLDTRALPDPEVQIDDAFTPPATGTERQLSRLWAEILAINESTIGRNTDFFDAGGDSLKTLTLRNSIREKFQVDIDIKDFFRASTIRELGKKIEASGSKPRYEVIYPDIQKAERRKFYKTSFAQDRMLYEYMANAESLTNNISKTFCITGVLDLQRLQHTFQALVQRHDSLRTCFIFEGDGFVQYVAEQVPFDLVSCSPGSHWTLKDAVMAFVRPFDPARAPLFRVGVWQDGDGSNYLLVDMHHIVCDGISLDILMNDFVQIYSGNTPEPLPFRYVDYADWQRRRIGSLATQGEYWSNLLAGELPRINLPIAREREGMGSFPAGKVTAIFDPEETRRIRDAARAENVSDFMYMLAAYYVLLYKISGDTDIVVGTDAAGRTHPGLTQIVGTFINVMPLRLSIGHKDPFRELLARVKESVLEGINNQDLQYNDFGSLSDNGGGQPVFDVYFSFANFFGNIDDLQRIGFIPTEVERGTYSARYELELNVTDKDGEFVIAFLHSTALYDRAIVELFLSYYRTILFTILNNSLVGIESIELETSEAGKV